MIWLTLLCVILNILVSFLSIKMLLLYKTIDEIQDEMKSKLNTETNTLISISSGDKHLRRYAAELNKQLRMLRKERRTFQNGDMELREAITNISHDLRTPLTAIYGYLDLLKKEEKSELINRYLEIIENRTAALKQLTDELFQYSIITSASKDMNYQEVNVNGVLEESISAYYGALKNRGIIPRIDMPDVQVVRILDKGALSRIFENVIGNAMKYSDGDLQITMTRTGQISFMNTATSLTEVHVGKLFDRFYTVESARKSTGLGLSISKYLVEQMNGKIEASYEKNQLSIIINL